MIILGYGMFATVHTLTRKIMVSLSNYDLPSTIPG